MRRRWGKREPFSAVRSVLRKDLNAVWVSLVGGEVVFIVQWPGICVC